MISYIIRKLLYSLLIIWGVVSATFLLTSVLPGDPARMAALGFHYRGIGRSQFERFAATPAVAAARSPEPMLRSAAQAAPAPAFGAVSRA